MRSRPPPLLLLSAWLGLLVALAFLTLTRLEVGSDLRLFMPTPQTAEQRLLLDSVGEGPGSRLLLLAVSGADAETLAEHSRALAGRLQASPGISRVVNAEQGIDALDPELLRYRYLLTPGFDQRPLDAAFLHAQLRERLLDLGSPAAALVEPWVGRDPSLEVLRLAELWQPMGAPELLHEVWFDRDHSSALLLVETAATGFDPQGQREVMDRIHRAFDAIADDPALQLEVSGPGAFSVLMRERTQGEASRLGLFASLGVVLLLCAAYRSVQLPLLGALPLVSAVLAGLATVAGVFGSIHGITLAFGITLIGIAQDYPVHLFSHHRSGQPARTTMRMLWPTLTTGVLSTCLAYLSFLVSGVDGLKQLAAFAVSGLITAALCTWLLLPALLPARRHDVADGRVIAALASGLSRLPRPRWVVPVLALLALGWLLLSPRPLWDDSLANLTPVPAPLLERDAQLRQALGAPDVRYMIVIEAADLQALLERSEALAPALDALVTGGALESAELPSRYLPSVRTQRLRQQQLPEPEQLAAALEHARAGTPFRANAFAPFQAELEQARQAPPLQRHDLEGTMLASRLDALLPDPGTEGPVSARIALGGVHDAAALAAFAGEQGGDVHLLDLRGASESLAGAYRERVLLALLAAVGVLALALGLALRDHRRMLRVLVPVLLSSLLVVALLHAGGVSFNLFHLVALILAAGLGLDYALFFEHAAGSERGQRRTLHAIIVCAISTGLVFGLLATSSIPVLQAIGSTVALGVLTHFIFAALIAASNGYHHARP